MDPQHTFNDAHTRDPSNGFALPLPNEPALPMPIAAPHDRTDTDGSVKNNRRKDSTDQPGKNETVDLIRNKLRGIYATEPDAVSETIEAAQAGQGRSKHQQYMYELSTSGKSLADIQTEWHNYYAQLPDNEKHEVWQEFYASSATNRLNSIRATQAAQTQAAQQPQAGSFINPSLPARHISDHQKSSSVTDDILKSIKQPSFELPSEQTVVSSFEPPQPTGKTRAIKGLAQGRQFSRKQPQNVLGGASSTEAPHDLNTPADTDEQEAAYLKSAVTSTKAHAVRTVEDVKKQVLSTVTARGTLKRKHHLQSLAFGLATGSLVILVLLFGFFNERFIAPFITPSRNVSATPLIVDETSEVSKEPKMIIPKINVELPVDYNVPTIDDAQIEAGLEGGVVHYPTTANPGEKGNAVLFGHSSSNILNNGKYKFAFVLLNRLENGDTFYVHKDGKRFVYKVFGKKIVKPTQVEVLNPIEGKIATATLITCDPPGTSINRLVVMAEQISPDPAANTDSTALQTDHKPVQLASNAPSLWRRFVNWLF